MNVKPWPRDTRYSISDDGVVYGIKGQVMRTRDQNGYRILGLSKNGKTRPHFVHRLVLETFVGPCPDGMECCHNNGIRDDNRLSNLRWDTRKENVQDCLRHGNQHMANRTHCKNDHEFTPENTKIHPGRQGNGPYRMCRECKRLKQIRHRAEHGLPPRTPAAAERDANYQRRYRARKRARAASEAKGVRL